MISVIFPIYNEEKSVEELHRRLVKVLSTLNEPYEIIAVDDGSIDGTRQKLIKLSPITTVLFSRNFGQNAALDAGFKIAIGDFIVTLDSDLQNDPEDIIKIIQKLREGYGAVVGWRKNRQDPMSRKIFSRLANWLVRKVTKVNIHDFSCALKGYRREFIDGIQLLGETFIFMPIFAHNRGANVAEVEIKHNQRKGGESKHHIGEMIYVLFDLISVKFLLNYFSRPLRFFGSWSIFFIILTFIAFVISIIFKIYKVGISPTLLPLMGVMFIILSVILFMLGFVTEILLRIYYERKDNAPYMIYEIVKNKKN